MLTCVDAQMIHVHTSKLCACTDHHCVCPDDNTALDSPNHIHGLATRILNNIVWRVGKSAFVQVFCKTRRSHFKWETLDPSRGTKRLLQIIVVKNWSHWISSCNFTEATAISLHSPHSSISLVSLERSWPGIRAGPSVDGGLTKSCWTTRFFQRVFMHGGAIPFGRQMAECCESAVYDSKEPSTSAAEDAKQQVCNFISF